LSLVERAASSKDSIVSISLGPNGAPNPAAEGYGGNFSGLAVKLPWDASSQRALMSDLRKAIRDVPDFPRQGILFRDIAPLLRDHLDATLHALDALLTDDEWDEIDALAGVESRGFILGAALAMHRRKGFVLVRKQGKLPPPVVDVAYDLEYGSGVLEMQRGNGRVVLIDDVLATGGTMTAAADLCDRAGFQLRALVALIDLRIVRDYSWRNLRLRAVIEY
jgi:adenine phosphoribosyltransferase